MLARHLRLVGARSILGVPVVLVLSLSLALVACSDDDGPPLSQDAHISQDAAGDVSVTGDGGPEGAPADLASKEGGAGADSGPVVDAAPPPGSFVAMQSGTTVDLEGVWAASSSDVWAVGKGGAIVHYDGQSWSSAHSGVSVDLLAIRGASSGAIWAVGAGGTVLHYDGNNWSKETAPTVENLNAVWATSPTDVWAVGDAGVVLHRGPAGWIYSPSATGLSLYGVWAANANDVWAVGQSATVMRHDNLKWKALGVPLAGKELHAVWGTSPNEVWVGGVSGAAAVYDGNNWKKMPLATAGNLFAIWGDAKSLWAVGGRTVSSGPFEGALFYASGAGWGPASSPSKAFLADLFGQKGAGPFAVGAGGTILRWE